MWSPTKLDFLFYDFSVIYYDFFKDLAEINRKRKSQKQLSLQQTIVTVAKPPSKIVTGCNLNGFEKFRM
jgi:hypothetical protein